MIRRKKRGKQKEGIILVLSGGGARGLAHIGVIEVLEENKIPVKMIIGTSMGALVGGLFSAGRMKELKKTFLSMTRFDVFKLFFSMPSLTSIFNCKKVDSVLKQHTRAMKIEKMKIPFASVAFNLSKGKRVIFSKGNLFDAIRASISIPFFFKPFKLGESLLIDGEVVDVVPVDIAKEKNSSSKIIAVNIETHPIFKKHKFNLINILDAVVFYEFMQLAHFQEKEADLVIKPKIDAGHFSFYRAKEIIAQGRKATQKAIPKIKRLLKGGKKNK